MPNKEGVVMNINEWTQRTDIDYEERMELGLPIEEEGEEQ